MYVLTFTKKTAHFKGALSKGLLVPKACLWQEKYHPVRLLALWNPPSHRGATLWHSIGWGCANGIPSGKSGGLVLP